MASRAPAESRPSRDGSSGLFTISPPFCQMNGARRIIDASVPSPYWSVTPSPSRSRVSACAVARKSSQVQPAAGSGTPAAANRSLL